MSPVSGPTLADLVWAAGEHDENIVDIDQLSSDPSFIVIDKAKVGTDILRRFQNV